MNTTIILLIASLVSLAAVYWIFPRVLKVAKIKGLVDNPDARKLQKVPVPVLGGIAVFFGFVTGLLTFSALYHATGMNDSGIPVNIIPTLVAASVMLYTGTLDDIMGLTPRIRIVIEVVTILCVIYGSEMCIDSFHGLWGVETYSWWLAVPLTVFASVGIINAYNMVDGVNGLSSGLCLACSCVLGVICWKRSDYTDAAIALCYAGSLVPFLLHNVFGKRSKMFIGDGGTMVMGLLVSWFVIRVLSSRNADTWAAFGGGDFLEGNIIPSDDRQLGLIPMMFAVTCVPIFDTLRVMTGRILRHESPFHADKTHLHHAFIAIGVSHSITALSEVLINMLVVAVWYVTYESGASIEVQLYVVFLMAISLVWGAYWFLDREKGRETSTGKWLKNFGFRTHLGHKDWWLKLQGRLDAGAYEDYAIILKEKFCIEMEDMSSIDMDKVAIVNFLQGNKSVDVDDIMASSGAEPINVTSLLAELEQEGLLEVTNRTSDGSMACVRLINLT